MNKKGIPKEIGEIEISMFKDVFGKNSENVNLLNLLEAMRLDGGKMKLNHFVDTLKLVIGKDTMKKNLVFQL